MVLWVMNNIFLIFIVGLPCSGKTTVAQEIVSRYGFVHFATESVRAEYLAENLDMTEDCDFTPEQHAYVYGEIEKRVKCAIADGKSVIVEGVYRNESQRAPIIEISDGYGGNVKSLFYYLTCDSDEAERRLILRKQNGTKAPAGVNGYRKIKREFVAPPQSRYTRYDTTNGTKSVVKEIIDAIGRCM